MGSYNSNYLHAAKKKNKGEGRGKYKFTRLRNYQRFSFQSKINYVINMFYYKKFSMGGVGMMNIEHHEFRLCFLRKLKYPI